MNTKNDVAVVINGRQYTISGYESSDYLQKIATHINSKYDEFKKNDALVKLDIEMKNALMAINLSDDYYKAQEVVASLQKDNEDLEKEIFNMKHDMINMKTQIEKNEKKLKSLKEEKRELERKVIQLETEAKGNHEEQDKESAVSDKTAKSGNALNSSISNSSTVVHKK